VTQSFWEGKQVLITGAGGFIGSHLTEKLVNQGAKVRAFVRYNSRNDPGLLRLLSGDLWNEIEVISGDLRDLATIQKAMGKVSHVFHLGALIAIPYSYLHPAEVVETNIMGTLNVLLAAREAQVTRVVHTSSSEVYGTALRVPIDESHPLQGQSPYSASKIGADKIAESFYAAYNLPVVTLRPFNTYGPRQSTRAVIPTLITQALKNGTLHVGNLDAKRDFTYVDDTVEGFLKIASTPNIEGSTINLGTGTEIRIGDLAKKIISMVGKPIKIQVDPIRLRPEKSEVNRLLSNNKLALERLGWKPEVTLDDGLCQTMDWLKDNLSIYASDHYVV
jgi:dTDP-glucose 4,6-dehydratase